MGQCDFDNSLFADSQKIIVACDLSPSSFKVKKGVLPPIYNILT